MNNNDWTIYWLRLTESGQEESWTIWWLIMKKSSCILIVLTYHINLEKKACLCLIKDLQSSVETQSLSFIHESALSWTRYHQPQYLTFIRWFIPLTDQIRPASVIITHHMALPSHWTDTISLIHYHSSAGSFLLLNRYHQSHSLLFIRWLIPLTDQIPSASVIIIHQMIQSSYRPDNISLSHY